jgi:hypothetical protein
MVEVVINACHGGFSLSREAVLWMRKIAPCQHAEVLGGEKHPSGSVKELIPGWPESHYGHFEHDARTCPPMVAAVKALGAKANGTYSELKVVEVPDDVEWHIHEYDGAEHVAENHRTWS